MKKVETPVSVSSILTLNINFKRVKFSLQLKDNVPGGMFHKARNDIFLNIRASYNSFASNKYLHRLAHLQCKVLLKLIQKKCFQKVAVMFNFNNQSVKTNLSNECQQTLKS